MDINSIKFFELKPIQSGNKSYYGKANVMETDTGEKYLISYRTIVCSLSADGRFQKHWDGYSVTSMKHINDFLALYHIPGGGKKWWEDQEWHLCKLDSSTKRIAEKSPKFKSIYF